MNLAEAAFFSIKGYNTGGWAEKRGGSRSQPWSTIHGLSDADLATELAAAIANDFRDHSGYHVDWTSLAGELGLTEAEQPAASAPKKVSPNQARQDRINAAAIAEIETPA